MQPSIKRLATSDDEDDLESLRLAALQSLKRPAQSTTNGSAPVQIALKLCNPKGFGGAKSVNKRGRGFHVGGRISRNGSYNRIRNSNLISVPTIEPDQSHDSLPDINRNKKFSDESVPKLVLPQDRYCNTKISTTESKACEASSKFDRYNDSDNSDSESESEDEKTSETESPRKLERANSLEALMQELENEIQGDIKQSSTEIATKPKKIKKSRKSKSEIVECEVAVVESSDTSETENKNKSGDGKVEVVEFKVEEKQKDTKTLQNLPLKNVMQESPIRRKSTSPVGPPVLSNPRRPRVRSPVENCIPLVNQPPHNLPYINTNAPVPPSVMSFQTVPYNNFNVHAVPFEPSMAYTFSTAPPLGAASIHSPPRPMFSPSRYERPISPLSIKTDILNTISAPLSPRSAAFVLQNREIIERRKKSPRRSYSRSPTPEFRRSLSPRYRRSNSRPSRSPSPVRQRHSPNRRISPLRRASPGARRPSPNIRRLSPNSQLQSSSRAGSRRASPASNRFRLSPPKRSSPNDRISPKRSHKSRSPQRSSVRNRLGTQQSSKTDEKERKTQKRSRSISLSLSPSPERFCHKNLPVDNQEVVNPILEARRRKFEASGSVPTEGIIRLKPKTDVDDEEEEERPEGGSLATNDGDEQQKSEQQAEVDEEALDEEELLGGDDTYIDFNVKVDDLFSDEESDNENEGRFKSSRQQTPRDVIVMPFTQLLNGPSKVKSESLVKDKRSYERDRDRREKNRFNRIDRDRAGTSSRSKNTPERSRHKDERDRERRPKSRSPLRPQIHDSSISTTTITKNDGTSKNTNGSNSVKSHSGESSKKESGISGGEKRIVKNSALLKFDSKPDRKRPPIVSPIENKKIEIKIRNPSKYEVESRSYDVANKGEEPVKERKSNLRKVEVASNDNLVSSVEGEDFDEPEPEIIVENEDDEDEDVVNKNEDAGDLRAQLSRKRAERQNKLPKVEGVSSRLLQNALQGAVFKKSKKSKSKKKDKDAAPLDDVDASVYAAVRRTTAKTGCGVATDINCSTASKDRKVRVLHFDAEPLTAASDGKLPIHLRLGIPGTMDIFTESKTHKISRKRSKNRGSFDQV